MRIPGPDRLLVAGDPVDPATAWVRPALVAEVKFTGWAGSGRLRYAVYVGLREGKTSADVVREVADPEAPRMTFRSKPPRAGAP
jgi:ATP-dependent DNA ligase